MRLWMLTYMVINLKYINQVLILHTNLYSAICQWYLNKTIKQTKTQITTLQFWRSEVQYDLTVLKSRCLQGSVLSGGCTFHCLFHFLEAVCIPWLTAPSSIFKVSNEVFSMINLTLFPLSHFLLWLWPSAFLS